MKAVRFRVLSSRFLVQLSSSSYVLSAAACSVPTATRVDYHHALENKSSTEQRTTEFGDNANLKQNAKDLSKGRATAGSAATSTVGVGSASSNASTSIGTSVGTSSAVATSAAVTSNSAAAAAATPTCPQALASIVNTGNNASPVILKCVADTPAGGKIELLPGVYTIATQMVVSKSVTLVTKGRAGSAPCGVTDNHGCAELKGTDALVVRFGLLILAAPNIVLDHIVLNGNRQARPSSLAMCKNLALPDSNQFGMTAFWLPDSCPDCKLTGSTSKNAVCGSGALIGKQNRMVVELSAFVANGLHTEERGWSDGLTVLDCKGCRISDNSFVNNTDVDLIFGGCIDCSITRNTVTHDGSYERGAFAAMMFGAFAFSTPGVYMGSIVENSSINCGTKNGCGIGLYLGNRAWYSANRVVNGTFRNIDIMNAQAGVVIDDVTGTAIGAIGAGPSNGNVRCAVRDRPLRENYALNIAPDSAPQFLDPAFGRDKYVVRSYIDGIPNSSPGCQPIQTISPFDPSIAQGKYIPDGFPACSGGQGYKPGNNSCLPSCGMRGTATGLVPQVQNGACTGAGPWTNLGDTFDIAPGQTCCGVAACPANYGYKMGNNSCLPSCGLLGYASGYRPQIIAGGCPASFTYLGDSFDAGPGLACCGQR